MKLHDRISAVLHTQTSVGWFPSACICLGERNGRMNGKQLEFRVRKTRQEVDTQKCPCWTGLLLTALLSECTRITEKISMRTAAWSTMPLEKNSLGLWINALCVSGSDLPCLLPNSAHILPAGCHFLYTC